MWGELSWTDKNIYIWFWKSAWKAWLGLTGSRCLILLLWNSVKLGRNATTVLSSLWPKKREKGLIWKIVLHASTYQMDLPQSLTSYNKNRHFDFSVFLFGSSWKLSSAKTNHMFWDLIVLRSCWNHISLNINMIQISIFRKSVCLVRWDIAIQIVFRNVFRLVMRLLHIKRGGRLCWIRL